MADPTPLLEEGRGRAGVEEATEVKEPGKGEVAPAWKKQLMDWVEASQRSWMIYETPLSAAAFIAGYYADVFMEIYSAVAMSQTPQTQILSYALVFIIFVSPVVCWLLLLSNELASVAAGPLYIVHAMPILGAVEFGKSWRLWKAGLGKADTKHINTRLPLRKNPVLTWLPICKAAFSSSLTLLFKVYGSFLQTRNYMDGTNLTRPALRGVLLSVCMSIMGMSYSIVKLSYYGLHRSILQLGGYTILRALEVFSRVSSVGLFGIVYAEQHSITALLIFDLVLQMLILVLHPAPRRLLKNGMSFLVLVFWALLMILCAPPQFIPQLKDMHAVYFVVRTLELVVVLGAVAMRCGWPGAPAIASRSSQLEATCAMAHIDSSAGTTFWGRVLVSSCYATALGVVILAIVKVGAAVQRRFHHQRLRQYRLQQAAEADGSVGEGLAPVPYDEVLYLRVSSVSNRFLLSAPGAEPQFQAVSMPVVTDADMKKEDYASRAAWRFLPTSEEASEVGHVRFGDTLRIRSDVHVDRFLSGGRRGNNTFVGTHLFLRDLQEFPLDYDLEEHYTWKVVAVRARLGPDPEFRVGETLDFTDRFALLVMPGRVQLQELYLSGCRGPTTEPTRCEVWTLRFHSRPAFEDSAVSGSWPSFEFFAQRRPVLDSDDITQLACLRQKEKEERGAALATAGESEDIMMQTFMMQSGMPMNVTDDQYFTPLHHFIFQYAREGHPQMLKAQEAGKTDQAFDVEHKVPMKVFQQMLHSGLQRLELHAKAGYTPLHFAALLGERRLCDALVEAGADINVGDGDGWTCLHDAVLYDHRATLKYLLNQPDLDPNTSSRTGVRPVDLTKDPEVLGWLAAKGAKLTGTRKVAVTKVPAAPQGSKFFTHFVDPRDHGELGMQQCAIDKQTLAGKFLAVQHVPAQKGKPVCFYCVRFAWSNQLNLCPYFRCPGCYHTGRIPYFDSDWDVCWRCTSCTQKQGKGTFPHWQRIETGMLQYGASKAMQLFTELDTDGSGTLSKSEFVVLIRKLHGKGEDSESHQESRAKTLDYCEQILEQIDTDGDGSISFEEFRTFFRVRDLAEGLRVRVLEDFDPLTDEHLLEREYVASLRRQGMKATVKTAAVSFKTSALNVEGACVLSFDDGICAVGPQDQAKICVLRQEEDEAQAEAAASAKVRTSRNAAQTMLLRKGQRTTFACVPCVERCLLLA